jgi:uncharacterized protein YecT (DUF1311 family)
MQLAISLAALFLGALASPAGASCGQDPKPLTSESCVVKAYMAAYGELGEAVADVSDDLRSLASSNPESAQDEATFMAAQQAWFQRMLKWCGDEDARRPGGPDGAYALECMTPKTTDRAAEVKRYLAELEGIKTLPSTKPPIAPVYDCSITDAQLGSLSGPEQCFVKAIAPRCNVGDSCHVRCLAAGAAQNVGGGCYHVCARSGPKGAAWQQPPEAAACWPPTPQRAR